MALPRADDPTDAADGVNPDFAAVLGASAVPAFLSDPRVPGEPIVFVNAAFVALTGHAPDAAAGQGLRLLQGRHADREARAAFDGLLEGEGGRAELTAYRADGSAFFAEIVLSAIPGHPHRLGEVLDVTRRRDAEEALVLSRRREALGLLTNSVAHEFNNFLQILIGYIDGLKRRLGDRPEPFVQRAILRSTDATERATILTRQLLAYSRRIAPDVRPIDLNALIAAFAAEAGPGLPARLSLTVGPTPGLPPALSNPTQIAFALSQILANACEAMPGDGTIAIETFAVAPGSPGMQRPGDRAVGVAIRDSGHGMTPEMAARALAPFATSREAGRGTGLAIVHGLMKRQNGTVSIESRPGEGTTVRLVFPAVV